MSVHHIDQLLFDIGNILVNVRFTLQLSGIANAAAGCRDSVNIRRSHDHKCFQILLTNVSDLDLHSVELR